MKYVLWMPFLLLIGLVAGGLATRQELRETREQLMRARRDLEQRQGTRGGEIQGVTQLLGIGGASQAAVPVQPVVPETRARRPRVFFHGRRPAGKTTGDEVSAGERQEDDVPAVEPENRPAEKASESEADEQDRDSMKAQIEQAAELWTVRSDIARSTFISNLNLDKDQTAQFDVLMEAMNLRMQDKIGSWVETVKKKETVGPEDGVRLANDVTGILVLTYDEMDRKLPGDWRAKSGKDLHLVDFVDPTVAMPLIDVEDKLSDVRARPR